MMTSKNGHKTHDLLHFTPYSAMTRELLSVRLFGELTSVASGTRKKTTARLGKRHRPTSRAQVVPPSSRCCMPLDHARPLPDNEWGV